MPEFRIENNSIYLKMAKESYEQLLAIKDELQVKLQKLESLLEVINGYGEDEVNNNHRYLFFEYKELLREISVISRNIEIYSINTIIFSALF